MDLIDERLVSKSCRNELVRLEGKLKCALNEIEVGHMKPFLISVERSLTTLLRSDRGNIS